MPDKQNRVFTEAGADALNTVFRACNSLDSELKTRAATSAESQLLGCRARLTRAGWSWDSARGELVHRV